jgi:hypothetical protein
MQPLLFVKKWFLATKVAHLSSPSNRPILVGCGQISFSHLALFHSNFWQPFLLLPFIFNNNTPLVDFLFQLEAIFT